MRTVRLLLLTCLCLISSYAVSQDYLYATGNPSFGVNIPIENGFINVSNGNLHLEFPLATHKQRGALQLNERLVYDSRIWMIGHYSNYYWWPNNIPNTPNTQGGWRFVTGNETGNLVAAGSLPSDTISTSCPVPPYNGQHVRTYTIMAWNDPQGTKHTFNGMLVNDQDDCAGTYTWYVVPGAATDASGYVMDQDASGNPIVKDNNGTQVYPQVIDRFGNYWSTDANGNLIDDLGRTPVIVTKNGNVTYYDVLAPNGPINNNGTRVRYTVTTAPIQVKTYFHQPVDNGGYIVEWPDDSGNYGTLYPVQSIQLPDGTSYAFTYDSKVLAGDTTAHYGDLKSITLPTGGVINYRFEVFEDSYYNQNRWLSSRTLGNSVNVDPTTTFTHSVISWCGVNGLNCKEKTIVHRPSGDETVYEQQINNGAWNTNVSAYTGSASGTPLLSTTNTYSFQCSGCSTNFITKSTSVTTLSNGLSSQQQYIYNSPQTGKPTTIKEWDYFSGSAPSNPTRETDYSYSGYDLSQVTVYGNGSQASQTTYDYTSSATATSGLSQHGSANAGGPYLQKITDKGTGLYTTYTFDDAGILLSSTDSNGSTTYGHDSSDTNVTSVTLPTPSSGVVLSTSSDFDFNSGVVKSATDENGQLTNYYHYDTAGRPTGIDYPDGSTTTFSYGMYQSFHTSDIFTANSGHQSTLYDPYGRLSRTAVFNGQPSNSWYQVDRCYDSNGNLQFVSSQYQASGFDTQQQCSGNGTAYTYDVLGRILNIHTPDGDTSYQYSSRATKVVDVSGVQKITQTDALGRITDVCEISNNNLPASDSPASCGLDIAGSGYLTHYAYDLANHKTTITQGIQTRTFQTDSLGRTISTKEPERGITTYGYSYPTGGLGLQVVRTRPKANQCVGNPAYPNQCDPTITTTTTTQYDAVGRVLSMTYSDGTPTKTFTYDQSAAWGGGTSLGASKGHLTMHAVNYGSTGAGAAIGYDVMGRVNWNSQCVPSGCGNSAYEKISAYSYDGAGNLLTAGDGTVTATYSYSPAAEVTGIASSMSGATYPSLLAYNIQNGPSGPVIWSLGNGLTGVNSYDWMGRSTGGWVCNQSSQAGCSGGTQLYGNSLAYTGAKVNWRCDTAVNSCNGFQYDEFGRLSGMQDANGASSFSYVYDRYGNRWQQNAQQGGPSPSITFNQAVNQIFGATYDAAGNIVADGTHGYTYDAEGNLIKVDNGTTATYYYNALNQRVRAEVGSVVREYTYNLTGQRATIWDGTTRAQIQGTYYWGGSPVAYYNSNGVHFQHQDWLGTERIRTSYNGATEGTYSSLPFGDGSSSTGSNDDPYHFARLDHDTESNSDHAQFRNYSPTQGRWLAPDPYLGSINLFDPQSLNRYSYVGNSPLAATDPSGLLSVPCLWCGDWQAALTTGLEGAVVAGIGYGVSKGFEGLIGLFSHPSCHSCDHPRPSSNIWDEHGSFHASPYSSIAAMIGDVGGWYPGGCEFGACGNGFQQGNSASSGNWYDSNRLRFYLSALRIGTGMAGKYLGFCSIGGFVYAGYEDAANHRFVGYLGEIDSETGISHNGLLENSNLGGSVGSHGLGAVEGMHFIQAGEAGGALIAASSTGPSVGLYGGWLYKKVGVGVGGYTGTHWKGRCK